MIFLISVYGKRLTIDIKEIMYSIIIQCFVSIGGIDAVRYVYNMAKKYNYFGILDNAVKLQIHSLQMDYLHIFHSDRMSGYNDTNEYFMIRVQQCIDMLGKRLIHKDNMLLSMACDHFEKDIEVNKLTEFDRIILEQSTANYGIDITHRILYCLNQLQIAIKQHETATNNRNKFKFNYWFLLNESIISLILFEIIRSGVFQDKQFCKAFSDTKDIMYSIIIRYLLTLIAVCLFFK